MTLHLKEAADLAHDYIPPVAGAGIIYLTAFHPQILAIAAFAYMVAVVASLLASE